jgi:sec-independent protein translocase protein TatA
MSATLLLFPKLRCRLRHHRPLESRNVKMGSMSIVHWLIVVAVVLLLFGRGKIPELMGEVAIGIKSFKKGMQDDGPKPNDSTHPQNDTDHRLSPRDAQPAPYSKPLNREFLLSRRGVPAININGTHND